ncbi:MAG: hypothetical protein AAGE01_07290 [Pseudomonadota bacterium]
MLQTLIVLAYTVSVASMSELLERHRQLDYGPPIIVASMEIDLNADGLSDHIALFSYAEGTVRHTRINHHRFLAYLLASPDGGFVEFEPQEIGRVGSWFPETMSFEGGLLQLSGAKWAAGDAVCCASGAATRTFRLADNRFVELRGIGTSVRTNPSPNSILPANQTPSDVASRGAVNLNGWATLPTFGVKN